jgi:hypothetical protein
MTDEFERIWKEAWRYEGILKHFPGGTEETHEKLQPG